MSFNPCFNGSCKRTSPKGRLGREWNNVSILVLMEVVKEPYSNQAKAELKRGFQSLF